MINIKPIQAIYPEDKILSSFVSNSVDSYSKEELKKKAYTSDSFLSIIEPTFNKNISAKERYKLVRKKFEEFRRRGILKKDLRPYLYIYRQETDTDSFTGVLGCVSIDNYLQGYIKPHEETIKKRSERFAKYLQRVDFQAEPILLTYKRNNKLRQLISMQTHPTPQVSFLTEDGTTHSLWVVKDRLILHQFNTTFKKIGDIYIADGHHRLSSSVQYTLWKRKQAKEYSGLEPFNYMLAFFLPGNELKIYDYNRLVTDLNGYSTEEFLRKIEEYYTVDDKGEEIYIPSQKNHLSMYLNNKFYGLFLKHELRSTKGVELLDTYQLEKNILKKILDIKNIRKTKRLSYIPGNGKEKGLLEMKNQVDSGNFAAGFGLYPIPIQELQAISDQSLYMPPKSTYILPKLKSGMIIHQLND